MRRTLLAGIALLTLVVGTAATAGTRHLRTVEFQPAGQSEAFVPGEVIVRFKPGVSADSRQAIVADERATVRTNLLGSNAALVRLAAGESVPGAMAALKQHAGVLDAQPNFVYQAEATPADSFFGLLWGLNNTGQLVGSISGTPDADIDAPEAWDVTTGSRSVSVAVVDTGVEYTHPDLVDNVPLIGWDFYSGDSDPRDENGHGTHVAGTIGAKGNNGVGVAGVNWNVGLLPVRVLGPTGTGTTAAIANGFAYAAQYGARIVNASLGASSYDPFMASAIAGAPATLFVVAAGNGGTDGVGDDNDAVPRYPCNYPAPNVICVAATDINDSLAAFSNYGASSVDLAAPGVQIGSTYLGGDYVYLQGTSMATPHVAGVAALLLARNPAATVAQLRAALLGSVDVLPGLNSRVATSGRLNAQKAVAAIGATPPPPPPPPPPPADTLPPTNPSLFSPSHTVGLGSRVRTLRIRWSGASDSQSGVDGYSYQLDNQPGSVPDETKESEESIVGVDTVPLANDRWYFHLRTRDNAGNWTSASHIGPFVIAVPRPVAKKVVTKVTLCHKGRTIKVPKSQVKKHRKHGDKLGKCKPKKKKRGRA